MKTHTTEIDGELVTATTTDGAAPYRKFLDCGGYLTNERAICACGKVCESAGDRRCNACQAAAAKALSESVRLGVAAGKAKRAVWKRFAGAKSREDY